MSSTTFITDNTLLSRPSDLGSHMPPAQHHSLKQRVLRLVAVISLVGAGLTLAMFFSLGNSTMQSHARQTARLLAVDAANHIRTPIRRELALARKLADTPLLADWARDDENPKLRQQALPELHRYAQHFSGGSVFFVTAPSLHYYFLDAATPPPPAPKYTLAPDKARDVWYFNTMRHVGDYAMNVNYDAVLNTTKVWINVIVRAGDRKVGLAGTGLDLGLFIKDVVDTGTPGVSMILFDHTGKIQAHQDPLRVAINASRAGDPAYGTMSSLLGEDSAWSLLQARMTSARHAPDTPQLLSAPALSPAGTVSALVYLPELAWYGLVRVDTSALLNWTDFAPMGILLIGSLLIMLAALTWILNRVVLSPLALLTNSTRNIAAGKYEPVLISSPDEFGSLAASFNEMSATVRDHTENLENLVRERTEALEASRDTLQARNKQILDSIEYARAIQQTILPPQSQLDIHLREHFLIWRPRDIVGGDFYTFAETAGGWTLGVADCTGHGVPGAFMSMAAHAAMEHAMATVSTDNPGQIIGAMNRIMRNSLHRDAKNPALDNGLDLGLCCFCRNTGTLRFAGARMDLLVSEQGSVRRVRGTAHSIGYRRSDPDALFEVHDIPVLPDTVFYLFSDGITDQSGGKKGFGLGRKKLIQAVEECTGRPLEAQQDLLLRRLAEHQGTFSQRDDITMIGFRPCTNNTSTQENACER